MNSLLPENIVTLSDSDLVVYVRTQDQEAYRHLIDRFAAKIIRYASFLLQGNSIDPEEMAQEIFVKAFVNLHQFDIKRSFSTWLYRIAHNETMNAIFKHKRGHDSLKEIDVQDENATDPLEHLDSQKKATLLGCCLAKLPEKYRSPLVFFYLEQESYITISDILQIPVATVGTLIHRGRLLLKGICKQEGLHYE